MSAKARSLPQDALSDTEEQRVDHAPSAEVGATSADESTETDKRSALGFALLWFGIPLVLILAGVFLRGQCNLPS